MLYYNEYKKHVPEILGKRKKFDNTIYTFDIETTSYYTLNGINYPAIEYLNLTKKEQQECEFHSCMYIWMFGINDTVFYGRTWIELMELLYMINEDVPDLKILYIHNLSFEFQFLMSVFNFDNVMARKSHKPMKAKMVDYNFEVRCSYILSNCKLENVPKLFNLEVEKAVGNLDYNKIRHSKTPLSEEELYYCEMDIIVLYKYIYLERETYTDIKHIPMTSTGKVRRELNEKIRTNWSYKNRTRKMISTDPVVFNRLNFCFMGGYTHSNYIYTNRILENIDSWDICSSYPYVLTTYKYPSSEFRKCEVKTIEDLRPQYAYLLTIRFKNVSCKYYNNFISVSKCRDCKGVKVDNGRIIQAKEFVMTITEVDFKFYHDTYNMDYEIEEAYFATKNYLPKVLIEFILDKYVKKTEYKGVKGMELEYSKEKNKFNSIYGMSVTNEIRSEVIFNDLEWLEEELTNDDIIKKLEEQKVKAFMSYSTGVYVTAYAREALLRRVIELDEFAVYMDTDSCKCLPGYDKNVFYNYNKKVENRIKFVSNRLGIDINKYAPKDKKGVPHMLGVFELETKGDRTYTYDKLITQGAKKYCTEIDGELEITVSGVPKDGAKELKSIDEFRDDLVFHFENTNKLLLAYVDHQEPIELTDYLGETITVKDKSGCCLIPTTYTLGKSLDYVELIIEASSKRATYKE